MDLKPWKLERANSVNDIGWIINGFGNRLNSRRMSLKGLKDIVEAHNNEIELIKRKRSQVNE